MEKILDSLYQILKPVLYEHIQSQPAGVKEYDLMLSLSAQGFDCFTRNDDKDPSLDLFHRHFILFHCLYRLQADLKDKEYLSIFCLSIQLLPLSAAHTQSLATYDGERAYYLDVTELETTSANDVTNMINDFWQHYDGHLNRDDALTVLGIQQPATSAEIERAYRRLVMEHHPDRGGDAEKFCEIKHAWDILKRA